MSLIFHKEGVFAASEIADKQFVTYQGIERQITDVKGFTGVIINRFLKKNCPVLRPYFS